MYVHFLLGVLLFSHSVLLSGDFIKATESISQPKVKKEENFLWKSPGLPVIHTDEFNKVMDEIDKKCISHQKMLPSINMEGLSLKKLVIVCIELNL
ncbi:hypothetical protein AAHH67_05335 [Niallia circulans]